MPMSAATAASPGVRLKVSKTGSRSCIAWPSLLRLRCASAFKPSGAVEGVLLEETADRLAAVQEITRGRVCRAAVRGEDRRLLGRRHVLAREFHRALAQRKALFRRREVRQHEEAVAPVRRELLRRKPVSHCSPVPSPAMAAV